MLSMAVIGLCSGLEGNPLTPMAEPIAEVPITPLTVRTVEDWARIGNASGRARSCLEAKVKKIEALGGLTLEAMTAELISGCFARAGSGEQRDQADALPFTYAVHQSTGLPLELVYFCSDVCPTKGRVSARWTDVAEEECCQRGGVPDIHSGWPIYVGCVPEELSSLDQKEMHCAPNSLGRAGHPISQYRYFH